MKKLLPNTVTVRWGEDDNTPYLSDYCWRCCLAFRQQVLVIT